MNLGDFLPIFSFAAVIAGYGIWVGTIQNRLKKVEEQSAKAEDGENRIIKLEEKVDELKKQQKELVAMIKSIPPDLLEEMERRERERRKNERNKGWSR